MKITESTVKWKDHLMEEKVISLTTLKARTIPQMKFQAKLNDIVDKGTM